MNDRFRQFADTVSKAAGSSTAFLLAILIIIVWAASGPLFSFSDSWQLYINTFTTLVTFTMVFLIQNTQYRESRATQLKLDELIKATADARDDLIGVEKQAEAKLKELGGEK